MEKKIEKSKAVNRRLRTKSKTLSSKVPDANEAQDEADLKVITEYQAKTPLGKKLTEIRARAIASGMKLLSEEELDREIAERRGGVG